MNRLKQLCMATVITLAFSLNALAGEMDTPGVTSQPCQPATTVETSTPCKPASEILPGGATVINSASELARYLFESMMYSIY
jgi:hypothetical protein